MAAGDNAIATGSVTLRRLGASAAVWGGLGVLGFSFSLPATRVAVGDLDASVVALGRAAVAAVLAAALLAIRREPMPERADVPRLAVVGVGVVIGFPLFSSLALRELSSAHASVIVGLLPAATAALAVVRAGERPGRGFWAAAAAGLVAVLAFAATQGATGLATADLYVLVAVALGALGYAEGGALSRRYGGWQVICWALVLTAPVLLPFLAAAIARSGLEAGRDAWLGFAYVSLFSMFLAFFAWYHGLAKGGVARIGQLQLAMPVLTLVWAALLLGEEISPATVVAALAVLACVGATQRVRPPRTPAAASP
jgi:drug/metabolite transporter (DMT)-like permease